MPVYCCVPECRERTGGHTFPKDSIIRLKWQIAIRRLDPVSKKLWQPSSSSVVCKRHFRPEDYEESLLGERPRLKLGVVPTVFCFSKSTTISEKSRIERGQRRNTVEEVSLDVGNEVEVGLPVMESESVCMDDTDHIECASQCEILTVTGSSISIETFETNPEAIQYYTGFDNIDHFNMFFHVLGPAVNHLNYQCLSVTPKNQLLLTLMKIRQGKDDIELSILFKISVGTVSKIFNTWINFMFYQLKEIDIWPSKEIVQDTMPLDFKNLFPNTRVILDATETPIQKPSNINDQMATFSTYKHKNTLKTMIGITPRGAVSYVSDSYGGSASDRQIIERSDLCKNTQLFNPKDSIMADKGILVQDLFCTKDVFVNTPTVLRGKSQLEPSEVIKDRRVASKRIHIERVIGLSKTYKILKKDLLPSKVPLGSRIIYVCFALTNFRTSIVGRYA